MKVINVSTGDSGCEDSDLKIIYSQGYQPAYLVCDIASDYFTLYDHSERGIHVYFDEDLDNLIKALQVLKEEKEKFDAS